MEDKLKDLNYIFNEMPLYSNETFYILKLKSNAEYEVDKNEIKKLFKYLNTDNGKVITNCIWCDKEFSFNYNYAMYLMNMGENIVECSNIDIAYSQEGTLNFRITDGLIWGRVNMQILNNNLIEENYYLTYYISCNNIPNHVYSMNLLIRVQKNKIVVTKIGQYPSILSVKGFDFDKYKKQLKKYNAYEDYKNADLSMANNFFAGAYTYLRRVYEKQLNFYIDKDKPTLVDDRTETKIKAVKGNFDPRIHEHLKNLYSILSIGIHELDEEESKTYYEYLKMMIDMQLQFEKVKEETDKQTQTINAKISNIVTNLKQRKTK